MAGSQQWKIVLIDDEEDIRDVMALALQDTGYDVTAAADGESGLRLCDEINPQIVITDIRMPGMDGLKVLETLKSKTPDIEVIVATAFGEMGVAIRALQLDASDFITKPIDNEAMHMALRRAKDRYTSRKTLKDYTALLEKEKAETSQELVRTFSFQKNLIESSMDGIIGCDNEDNVITFNRSIEKMLGYDRKAVIRKMTLPQFFPSDDGTRFKEELKSERYGGKDRVFMYETYLLSKSEKKIPVQVSATVLLEQDQRDGLVCFFRDLREMRRMEREFADQASILHQDKMMALGRLAASVVHEINNPLSGILNYVRLMVRVVNKGALDEEWLEKFKQYLDLVEKETGRCSNIVSSLLTFSRKSPLTFESVSISDLIQRCVILSQHKLELQDISLETRVDENIPLVEGDFNQLQQCVINLIFNAIDAMPNGGTLTLTGRYDAANDSAALTVTDTGTGISEEDLPHIFEPFYTTKKEGYGVGLGLSTVYGILERHKGTVKAESRTGEGSSFIVEIPAKS